MLEWCGLCSGGPGEAAQGLCCADGQSEWGATGGVLPWLGQWLEDSPSGDWPRLSARELGGGVGSGITPRSALQGRRRHRGSCHPHPVLLEALCGPDSLPGPPPPQVGGGHHLHLMVDALSDASCQEGPAGSASQTAGELSQQSAGDVAFIQMHLFSLPLPYLILLSHLFFMISKLN